MCPLDFQGTVMRVSIHKSHQVLSTKPMAARTSRPPHGGLLAGLEMGHLIPAVELAKCLVAQHGLTVTIFAVTNKANQAEDELLQAATSSWPKLLNAIVLIPQMPVPPLASMLTSLISSQRW